MNSVSTLSLAIASSNAPVMTGSAGLATDAPQLFAAILAPFDAAATAAVRQSIADPGNALPPTPPETIEMPIDTVTSTQTSISLATTGADPRRKPHSLAGQPLSPSLPPVASDTPQPETDHAASQDDDKHGAQHRWNRNDETTDPDIAWCAVVIPPAPRPIAFPVSPAPAPSAVAAIPPPAANAFYSTPVLLPSNSIEAVSPQRPAPEIEKSPAPIAAGIVMADPAPSPVRIVQPQRMSFAVEPALRTIEMPAPSLSRQPSSASAPTSAFASIAVPPSQTPRSTVTTPQPALVTSSPATAPKPETALRPGRPAVRPQPTPELRLKASIAVDGASVSLPQPFDIATDTPLKFAPADVPVQRRIASLAPPRPAIVLMSNATSVSNTVAVPVSNGPVPSTADLIQTHRSPTASASINPIETAVLVEPASRPDTLPMRPVLRAPGPFAIDTRAPVTSARVSPALVSAVLQPAIPAPPPIQTATIGVAAATGLTLPIGSDSASQRVFTDATADTTPTAAISTDAAPARPVETSIVKPRTLQPPTTANATAPEATAFAPPSRQAAPAATISPKRARIDVATAGEIATAGIAHAHTVPATAMVQNAPLDMGRHGWPQAMIERIETLRDAADAVDTSIRVIPDKLGTIDVSVRRDGDVTHVHFAAEQAHTRTILADAQPRLAELADARGLRLGQSSIDAGTSQQQPQHNRTPQAVSARTAPSRAACEEAASDQRIA